LQTFSAHSIYKASENISECIIYGLATKGERKKKMKSTGGHLETLTQLEAKIPEKLFQNFNFTQITCKRSISY